MSRIAVVTYVALVMSAALALTAAADSLPTKRTVYQDETAESHRALM